jgi:DNA polymerase III gamma/tau subunit
MPDTITPTQTRGNVAYDASAAIVLTGQAQRALSGAEDFTVDSDEMLEAAGDDLRSIKALQKNVEAQRTTITAPLNQVLRAVNDLFRPATQYLEQAEVKLKGAMLTYTTEQQRRAEEARRRAEELARQERERLAAEQRRQEQIAREAAQAAERAAKEAAEAAARGDAEAAAAAQEQARVQAEAAEQANTEAQAAEVTAAVVSMPVAVAPAARVSGISTSKSVDFVVENLHALVQHVAEHPELITLLMVDSVKLRSQVRATGMNTRLPGVRVFVKQSMSARAA